MPVLNGVLELHYDLVLTRIDTPLTGEQIDVLSPGQI